MTDLAFKFWTDDTGQDIAEYAVMLAVILLLVVGTIRLVGSNANNAFSTIASTIQYAASPSILKDLQKQRNLFDIRQGSRRAQRKDYGHSLRPNARIQLGGHPQACCLNSDCDRAIREGSRG